MFAEKSRHLSFTPGPNPTPVPATLFSSFSQPVSSMRHDAAKGSTYRRHGWRGNTQARSEPACGAVFEPYGPIELQGTISLAASIVWMLLLGRHTTSSSSCLGWPHSLVVEAEASGRQHGRRAPGTGKGGMQVQSGSGRRTIFAPSVLEALLAQHRLQDWRFWAAPHCYAPRPQSSSRPSTKCRKFPEAGGQLFARFKGRKNSRGASHRAESDRSAITIWIYSGSCEQNRKRSTGCISRGLHFVGDWHTHPEPHPRPSMSDVRSIRQAVTQSKHHLNGFILLIAGTEPFPDGLFVSLYYPQGETTLLLDR